MFEKNKESLRNLFQRHVDSRKSKLPENFHHLWSTSFSRPNPFRKVVAMRKFLARRHWCQGSWDLNDVVKRQHQNVDWRHHLVGSWTNPVEKYARQIGSWNPKEGWKYVQYLSCHHLVTHDGSICHQFQVKNCMIRMREGAILHVARNPLRVDGAPPLQDWHLIVPSTLKRVYLHEYHKHQPFM